MSDDTLVEPVNQTAWLPPPYRKAAEARVTQTSRGSYLTSVVGKLMSATREELEEIDRLLGYDRGLLFLSVPQVLDLLGISRATLYRRIRQGKLRPLQVDGHGTYLRTEDAAQCLTATKSFAEET